MWHFLVGNIANLERSAKIITLLIVIFKFIIQKMENTSSSKVENKKVTAGVLAILIGCLGVHKFYLGYQKEGIIQIIITLVTFGFGGIIGFVEGIIYLTKSDEDFYQTYQVGKKAWF
ncbi:hypothetical protein GCM10022250_18710 [Flavobacterium chungbukense]|uniref:TM2 domain-containing protein n=2 Tax=Flavobacterium chungbukense TaxID=877464 RepID=A0ABP7Y173_9FLAO